MRLRADRTPVTGFAAFYSVMSVLPASRTLRCGCCMLHDFGLFVFSKEQKLGLKFRSVCLRYPNEIRKGFLFRGLCCGLSFEELSPGYIHFR